MEVRRGYKQTEVGIIPGEWEVVTVKQLVEKEVLEKPLDGNHGNIHPKSSDYVHYGIPFVMANNFVNGEVNLECCKFITKGRADKLQKGFSVTGDVLLTHKGTVGSTAIVGELGTDYIMLTPQVTYYRVKDAHRLNNHFLRHYFDSPRFQSLFASLAGGGTRAYLGIVKQLDLPIVTPPIDEQRAIAAALSDVDALLGGLDRLIAKKRDLKQAAMQQLLTGQTRLPGFGGVWDVKTFDSLFDRVFPKSTLSSGDGLEHGTYPLFVSGGEPKRIEVAQFRDAETLVFSDGGVFAVRRAVGGFSVTDHCYVLTLNPATADMRWFEAWFSLHAQQMDRLTFKGSGLRNLDKPSLRAIEVSSPERVEQSAIADVLSDMEAELAALETCREKTRDLKQAMMQELLTGKTRLAPAGAAHA